MRLKTKFQDKDFELGKVVNARVTTYYAENKVVVEADIAGGGVSRFEYNSIKDFTDHWEDAPEEPKKHYEILGIGVVLERNNEDDIFRCARQREIGNYFETEEEAEKALEKLKAFKRLKDKGFRFIDWELDMKTVADGKIWFDLGGAVDADTALEDKSVKASMDLLFGGEE